MIFAISFNHLQRFQSNISPLNQRLETTGSILILKKYNGSIKGRSALPDAMPENQHQIDSRACFRKVGQGGFTSSKHSLIASSQRSWRISLSGWKIYPRFKQKDTVHVERRRAVLADERAPGIPERYFQPDFFSSALYSRLLSWFMGNKRAGNFRKA